nr:STAS-like domain-containing protein [Paenibacillus sp. Marseille-P2973]
MRIEIASEFTKTPGPRSRTEGEFSGEQFREEILCEKLEKAFNENVKLIVNLDGTFGYGTSFLEEAFGGAARIYGAEKMLNHLEFISNEEPYLIDDITEYIEDTRSVS